MENCGSPGQGRLLTRMTMSEAIPLERTEEDRGWAMDNTWGRSMEAILRTALQFAIGVTLVSTAVAADVQQYLGAWRAGTVEGMGVVNNDPNCLAIYYTERKITLQAIPGNPTRVRGEWVRISNGMWLSSKNSTCRWPGLNEASATYGAVFGWTVLGVLSPADNSLHIVGSYEKCGGNSCAATGQQKDFETELRLVNGEVVDTNLTPQSDDDVVFVDQERELRLQGPVVDALKPMLALLDSGRADEFYGITTATFKSNTPLTQWRQNVKMMQERIGPVLSRSILTFVPALYCPQIAKTRGEYALVVNGVYVKDNHSTIEYILLVREDEQWRVALYFLAS
jgi:hypothetical protein